MSLRSVFLQSNYYCTGCGSTCDLFIAASGTISDGSGSSSYTNNALCEWVIAPVIISVITLRFTEFRTQPNKDYVRVYQCLELACSNQTLLAELAGSYSTTQSVTSTTGFMKVVFTSDNSGTSDGFTASWTSVSHIVLYIVPLYVASP